MIINVINILQIKRPRDAVAKDIPRKALDSI